MPLIGVRASAAALALAATIAACSSSHEDSSAITADDQRQLNDAAALLDTNSLDANQAAGHESSPHD